MPACDPAPVVDLILPGGGEQVAFTNGVLSALLPHIEIGLISATSGGAGEGLLIRAAQAGARRETGTTSGPAFRSATAAYFKRGSDRYWRLAAEGGALARNLAQLGNCIPQPWLNSSTLGGWEIQCQLAAIWGNAGNSFLYFWRSAIPGVEAQLREPSLSPLVDNSVNRFTGIERLTDTRLRSGQDLEHHAGTAIIPPLATAIDGVWIDGAFLRNGPVAGVLDGRTNPVLRIQQQKPDFGAYGARFRSHLTLRERAATAFAAVGEALPPDRPTAEIANHAPRSGCAGFADQAVVTALRAQGQADGQRALRAGLLVQLSLDPPIIKTKVKPPRLAA